MSKTMLGFLEGVPRLSDQQIVVGVGQLLFGEKRWQSPLARATGIPQSTISDLARGDYDLTDGQRDRLFDALTDWQADLKRKREAAAVLSVNLMSAKRKDGET